MNTTALTLLNTLRVASLDTDTNNAMAIRPHSDMLNHVFAALPLEPPMQAQLQILAQNPGSATNVLETILTIAQSIEQKASPGSTTAQEWVIERQIALLCVINALSSAATRSQGTVAINSLDVLRHIEHLHLAGSSGTPEIILVGTPAEDRDIAITLSSTHYVAQRVQITYQKAARYPRLNLYTPTMNVYDERPQNRVAWVQKPHGSYDLDVYTYKDRFIGRVKTTISDTLPADIDYALRLAFGPRLQLQLLITEVFAVHNDADALVTRCIKILPTPGQAADSAM